LVSENGTLTSQRLLGGVEFSKSENGALTSIKDFGINSVDKLLIKMFPLYAGGGSCFVNEPNNLAFYLKKLESDQRSEIIARLLWVSKTSRELKQDKTSEDTNKLQLFLSIVDLKTEISKTDALNDEFSIKEKLFSFNIYDKNKESIPSVTNTAKINKKIKEKLEEMFYELKYLVGYSNGINEAIALFKNVSNSAVEEIDQFNSIKFPLHYTEWLINAFAYNISDNIADVRSLIQSMCKLRLIQNEVLEQISQLGLIQKNIDILSIKNVTFLRRLI